MREQRIIKIILKKQHAILLLQLLCWREVDRLNSALLEQEQPDLCLSLVFR